MLNMIRRLTLFQVAASVVLVLIVAALAAFGFLNGSQATAGTLGGPTLGQGNAYYSGPVNACTRLGSSGTGYVEQHSFTFANCASGYAQFMVNQPYLAPAISFFINGITYECFTSQAVNPQDGTGDTLNEIRSISCQVSSTASASPSP